MSNNNNGIKAEIIRFDSRKEFETEERCDIFESWNDERDVSVSIARAKVRPGITTQLHRLLGITERYVIISGRGVVKVDDLAPEVVGPGDVVIFPENTPQQITNTGDEDLIFYCICTPRFSPDRYEALE